jgi:hypothetical protein
MEHNTTHTEASLIEILDRGEELLDKAKTVGGTIQQQVSRVLNEEGWSPSPRVAEEPSDDPPR